MFSPWALLIDVGLISVLLLLGKLVRARVRFIQKLFIPPSLIAGFTALALGPECLGWLPLSSSTGSYASVLIAMVFASLPLTSKKRTASAGVGRMWAYSQAGLLLQWALGGALGLFIISLIWPLDGAFGLSMPAGFCGGHGTAAAIGEAFQKYGFQEMMSFAMTSATVGIIAAVIVGLGMIKWAANNGHTRFLEKYSDLPDELRTGILPKDRRESIGESSFSAISLDSMTFNFGTIAVIAAGGLGISKLIEAAWPALMLPVFSCAFIFGLLVKDIYDRAGWSQYISPRTVGHLSGAFTDYLVAFGVASIKIDVVGRYIVPILILLVIGLVFTLLYVFLIGRRMHKECWFEKSIFTWGWFTGTMAMSIALLRIADPDMKSGCMDDYAYAYIYIAPVEIALVSLSPVIFASGGGGLFVGACALLGLGILAFAAIRGWLSSKA